MSEVHEHIAMKLEQFYPTSKKSQSEAIIGEIAKLFSKSGYGIEAFDAALDAYRNTANGQYCPEAAALKRFMPKHANSDPLWKAFVNLVILYGWDDAKRMCMEQPNYSAMLEKRGIGEYCREYHGFAAWEERFCQILHHEEGVRAAYECAALNCPEFMAPWYKRRAELFSRMLPEESNRYFPVLRKKAQAPLPI